MADETLKVSVEAEDNASGDLRGVATAVSSLSETLDTAVKALQAASRQSNALEKSVMGIGTSAKSTSSALNTQTTALREQAVAAEKVSDSIKEAATSYRHLGGVSVPGTGAPRVGSAPVGTVVTGQERASREASEFAREQAVKIARAQQAAIMSVVKANVEETRSWNAKNASIAKAAAVTGTYAGSAAEVAARMQANGFATDKLTQSTSDMSNSMFTARFALHDISNTAGIAGTALIAMAGAGVIAASQYETAMAAIERTSGATKGQMELIRSEFIDLAQSIPAGFDEMAKIGELAGQLNIAAGDISSFTETVAKFTSSTDVATQASAEAFGRLDELLPDVQHNYEALGSSILNVGVNSVATESAIISTTSQIAAAGAQAGLTAGEVIGLAASFASLGIAPEAARGSTIRIFSELRQATTEGGAALEEYARLAGMSASAFAENWQQAPADAFMAFLKGLEAEGAGAETVLRNLGITGVRDINALLRMSQNFELVGENIGYATDGFEDASALSAAFGITSQTLASRLQVLAQTVQALFATLGESSSGPLKTFVDLLISAGTVLTDALNSPMGQTIALMGGLSAVLGGGVLLIASAISRFGALSVALRITQRELTNLMATAVPASTALGRVGQAALAATPQLLTMRNAMLAIGATTAVGIGITAIIMGVQALGEATRSSSDIARDRFGDLSSLTSALKKDTKELADDASSAYGSFTVEVEQVVEKHSEWNTAMQSSIGTSSALDGAVDQVSEGVREQTYLIGENTKQWWANQLAGDEAMAELFKKITDFNNFYGANIDPGALIQAQIANDAEAVVRETEKIMSQLEAVRQEYITTVAGSEADMAAATDQVLALEDGVINALGGMSGAYDAAAEKTEYLKFVSEATGVEMTDAFGMGEESLEGMADSASNAASEIRQIANDAFSIDNAMAGMTNSADALFSGLEANGYMFDALSVGGAANMKNLQDALVNTVIAAEAMGGNATDAVIALFVEMQNQGINALNVISSMAPALNSLLGPGGAASIKAGITGQRQLGITGQALSGTFASVAQNAKRASSGTRSAGNAAREAAKEVRTLNDYASDLSKVWKRAFEIRFSGSQALDSITSSWREMSEAIQDARREYEETQRKIAELNTERSTLMYFQQVAVDYGDALRAAEIADELAENNAKLAEENKNAADAQSEMDTSLTGNSKAAVQNREKILGLVTEYQDYLQALAASGASQAELQAKSAQLRNEFVAQATRMGYNRTEVDRYAVSFDDMSFAISRVPRNITIAANVNPAMTALRELEAQAKRTASAVGGVGGGIGGGTAAVTQAANKMRYQILYLEASANSAIASSRAVLASLGGDPWGALSHRIQASAFAISALSYRRAGGFKQGGYTGGGGVNDVMGVVHGREFVVNAENTSRLGLDFLNALNSGRTPVAAPSGGTGTQVVELSAYDRQLLANAGNVSLAIDGKVVADASNAANFVSTKRGTN